MKPSRVCIKKRELKKRGINSFLEWSLFPGHLYVGRNMSFYVEGTYASKYQNPFTINKYGLNKCLELYEEHLRSSPLLMEKIEDILTYEEIGCWCEVGDRCHGDILIRVALENRK